MIAEQSCVLCGTNVGLSGTFDADLALLTVLGELLIELTLY